MFGERDSKFFGLFEAAAANVATAAQLLLDITVDPTTKDNKVPELEKLEHRGDELTHDILAELNRAFITPIDREDIFLIAKAMDNVIDAIEATGHRYCMLDINETTAQAQELAGINRAGRRGIGLDHGRIAAAEAYCDRQQIGGGDQPVRGRRGQDLPRGRSGTLLRHL